MANTLKFGASEWYGSEGNILAYNDENGNFKPLPFNFSRGSSATVVNKLGLIETVQANDARVEYLNNAKGALLLEPQRTNLITYSEQLNNDSGWLNQLGSTVIGGQIGVGNSLSAWKLNKGVGTFKSLRFQSSLSSANYTLSWYLKKGSLDIAEFRFDGGLGAQFIDFNLSTGVAGTNNDLTNIKIELINNDWYRCQASYNSTITNVHLYIGNSGSTTQEGYVYAQSPQLELGSYATSYIPTQGTAQTRLADSCSQTTPDGVIGQTEGTMYVNVKSDNAENSGRLIAISDGSPNNRIMIRYSSNDILIYAQTTTQQWNYTFSRDENMKIGIAYANNDAVLYLNGVQLNSLTSFNVPNCSKVFIGTPEDGGSSDTNVKINEFKLYNTRLSNSELAALTQV